MRNEDINIVKVHIDPYLQMTIAGKKNYNRETGVMTDSPARPVIVDDGKLPGDDVMMKGSQSDTALLLRGVPGNNALESWWMEYGRRVHERFTDGNPMGIRCDTCTALAFYLLRTHNCGGSISVIEQAQGNANGHWFLLVGSQADEELAFPAQFPRGSFVVDLWGVGVKRQRGESHSLTSVIDPPSCVYSCGDNQLKTKIFRPGSTTLPTEAAFKLDTFVQGWVGDKWRSLKLKAIDSKLNDFHKNSATGAEVAAAYRAWVAAKDSKYDEGPSESVRNQRGQLTALAANLTWLGVAV